MIEPPRCLKQKTNKSPKSQPRTKLCSSKQGTSLHWVGVEISRRTEPQEASFVFLPPSGQMMSNNTYNHNIFTFGKRRNEIIKSSRFPYIYIILYIYIYIHIFCSKLLPLLIIWNMASVVSILSCSMFFQSAPPIHVDGHFPFVFFLVWVTLL